MEKSFKFIENGFLSWLIAVLSFLMPLFFLPLTVNFFYLNKLSLLYLITGFLLLACVLKIFFERKVELIAAPLNLPVLCLVVIYLFSSLIQAPNQIKSLVGSTGPIMALGFLYYVIVNFVRCKKERIRIFYALITGGTLTALLTIIFSIGLLEQIGINWLEGAFFTPTGSPLASAGLFLLLIPGVFYWICKSKKFINKIVFLLSGGILTAGLIFITFLFINQELSLNYLWPSFGWQIAVEGLKNFRTALLGVGPGNFLSAFNRFRPEAINNTQLWNRKFSASSNYYLHLLSTVGIFGLAVYAWIIFLSLKIENFKGAVVNKAVYISLMVGFILQLLISVNLVLLFVTFLLAALLQAGNLSKEEKKVSTKKPFPVWLSIVGGVTLVVLTFWRQGKVWAADYYYYKSLQAAQQNNGGLTYNLQIKAIRLNPYEEEYRASYANTNLALANTLSMQEDMTDQKRSNIAQLISQAIREGKAAASLNSQISGYWRNLANIYRNLIVVADDASQWSIASYTQAVRTDPLNPVLRVELGSLFYTLENYEQAINQFSQAINLKPDYANAYYNLAAAYKEKEEWQKAYLNMRQVLGLVKFDSENYKLVNKELEEIAKNLEEVPIATKSIEAEKEQEITVPSPMPSPVSDQEKIDLPEEAAPEIPEEIEEEETATESGEL